MFKGAAQQFFDLIHGHRLIYNACWEDPRIDRQLLRLEPQSELVVITSAGCNILDYLLDSPKEIHAVDVNYRQNALLEFKLALFARGNFEDLFALFGNGGIENYQEIYRSVQEDLSPAARKFWDRKIKYFSLGGVRRSFYWRGAAGDFAWLMRLILFGRAKNSQTALESFLNRETLETQRRRYEPLGKKLHHRAVSWLIRQPWCLAQVGVPKAQMNLLNRTHPQGINGFVQEKIRRVMTETPIRENYFWRVYLTGSYLPECCPNYLKRENFRQIQAQIARVKLYNSTLTEFLKRHPGSYSHFVLLDHQDWLARHQPEALEEEWQYIFHNSRPRAKILMRSAGLELDFLPPRIRSRLRFFPERTFPLHARDRVGTYGSLHLAQVQ
ncbi:MAG TPA: DUF3419 domain-containing protein [Desulfobacterales bacterium]|nr:DUF3419 domain-containing protein [Desulfobacterales bacterium]